MSEASQRTIAIVDDDRAVRDSLRLLLEVMGYPAATFESASEFLRSDMREVECLILDYHMPNVTGLELAARLRAEGADIRILLTTSLPSPEIFARAAKLDIEVLEKPYSESDLLGFISTTGPGLGVATLTWSPRRSE
jgi:FixJ family two-component response regulator